VPQPPNESPGKTNTNDWYDFVDISVERLLIYWEALVTPLALLDLRSWSLKALQKPRTLLMDPWLSTAPHLSFGQTYPIGPVPVYVPSTISDAIPLLATHDILHIKH